MPSWQQIATFQTKTKQIEEHKVKDDSDEHCICNECRQQVIMLKFEWSHNFELCERNNRKLIWTFFIIAWKHCKTRKMERRGAMRA